MTFGLTSVGRHGNNEGVMPGQDTDQLDQGGEYSTWTLFVVEVHVQYSTKQASGTHGDPR